MTRIASTFVANAFYVDIGLAGAIQLCQQLFEKGRISGVRVPVTNTDADEYAKTLGVEWISRHDLVLSPNSHHKPNLKSDIAPVDVVQATLRRSRTSGVIYLRKNQGVSYLICGPTWLKNALPPSVEEIYTAVVINDEFKWVNCQE